MPHLPGNAANQSSATRHLHQVSQTRCTRDQINRSLIGLFMTLITLHHHHQGLHRHRDVPDIKNCKRVIVPLIAKYTKPIHFLPMISFFSLRSATCIKLILVNVKGLQASQSQNSQSISIALEPEAPAFYTSYWHLALNFQCVCEVQLCHRGLFAEDWIEVSCAPETSAATGTWNRFLSQRKTFLSSVLH